MIFWIILTVFLTVYFFSAFLSSLLGGNGRAEELLARRMGTTVHMDLNIERRNRMSEVPAFDKILRKLNVAKAFQIWLLQSDLHLSAASFCLLCLVLGALAFFVCATLKAAPLIVLGIVAAAAGFPFLLVSHHRKRKIKKFTVAFPDAVGRMASSLRAGYSLQMAFEALVEEAGNVVGEEFRKVLAEMEVGQNFENAITQMLDRVDTPDLRLFIASVRVQRESGGNLAELLDNLESTIQERFALQRELDAASSQARLSGTVLSLLPVFVGFFVFLIHKDYIMFFFDDPAGKNLFNLCLAGQFMGMFVIRKIVNIQM